MKGMCPNILARQILATNPTYTHLDTFLIHVYCNCVFVFVYLHCSLSLFHVHLYISSCVFDWLQSLSCQWHWQWQPLSGKIYFLRPNIQSHTSTLSISAPGRDRLEQLFGRKSENDISQLVCKVVMIAPGNVWSRVFQVKFLRTRLCVTQSHTCTLSISAPGLGTATGQTRTIFFRSKPVNLFAEYCLYLLI